MVFQRLSAVREKTFYINAPSAEEKAEILVKEAKEEIETLFTGEGLEEGEESLEESFENLITDILNPKPDTKKTVTRF